MQLLYLYFNVPMALAQTNVFIHFQILMVAQPSMVWELDRTAHPRQKAIWLDGWDTHTTMQQSGPDCIAIVSQLRHSLFAAMTTTTSILDYLGTDLMAASPCHCLQASCVLLICLKC